MNDLVLFDTNVKVNEDGMISLTDMWEAAKSAKAGWSPSLAKRDLETLRPAQFLRRPPTKAFIDELSKCVESTHLKSRRGNGGETFANKLLAVAYASWISPEFHLDVNQVFLDYRTGKLQPVSAELNLPNFADPVEAARAWADEVEQKRIAKQEVIALQGKVEETKPVV